MDTTFVHIVIHSVDFLFMVYKNLASQRDDNIGGIQSDVVLKSFGLVVCSCLTDIEYLFLAEIQYTLLHPCEFAMPPSVSQYTFRNLELISLASSVLNIII